MVIILMKNLTKSNSIEDIKKVINDKKIARVNFCSIEKQGIPCAEIIEKKTKAFIRGTMADKNEKPTGKCFICKKPAKAVVYIGKSY